MTTPRPAGGQARQYVVCVDDEQAVLNQLSAQLTRRFGSTHLVECTESAEEALDLIDEIFAAGDEVHLIICDQLMPGMKGDRFLETVNATRPEIMKILLTGQAGLESAIHAINQAGLHRYIEKPWEAEDLNMASQNLLTQYRLRRDLNLYNERLERRSRELHNLHEVGIGLGSTSEPDRVLALVVAAARSLSEARVVAVVAQLGPQDPARWAGLPVEPLGPEVRMRVEATLARLRADRALGVPDGLPAGLRALPIHQTGTLFGWILLHAPAELSQDSLDLFSILAGQAAASLNNVQFLQERLESERLTTIGRMISTIVHDFRNPMTAIKGYSGMIEEFELSRERQKECARLVIEESDRMSLMIDEILEFTRGGRSRLKLAPITVEELTAKVHRIIAAELEEKGIAYDARLDYAGLLRVDVERMKRAILNIASNALDAMGAGGTFTVESRLRDGKVELVFTDTGAGIPEELQPRIFEAFFTHGKPRGIGLGMSITRKIVEEHGGQIHLESRPGATRFTLRLPLEPAAALERDFAGTTSGG